MDNRKSGHSSTVNGSDTGKSRFGKQAGSACFKLQRCDATAEHATSPLESRRVKKIVIKEISVHRNVYCSVGDNTEH